MAFIQTFGCMQNLRCILVDDDEVARLGLTYYINKSGALDLLGTFSNAVDALNFLKNESVDVLFLDIDMPELSGFDMRKKVMDVPVCVFISAYPNYALESFGYNAFDFMQKPVKPDRFEQGVEKITQFMEIHHKAKQFDAHFTGDHVVIKDKQGEFKVKVYDIMYLEAYKNYTQIVTRNKEYAVLGAFGSLLQKDNFSGFVRIHKSYAVQKHFVKKILSNEVVLENDFIVPVGRSFKDNLKTLLA